MSEENLDLSQFDEIPDRVARAWAKAEAIKTAREASGEGSQSESTPQQDAAQESATEPGPPSEESGGESGGEVECPIYEREALGAGDEFSGPAIIEEWNTTTVVYPDQNVAVDTYGNLIITQEGAS